MANTATNTAISNLVASQVPEFIRSDYQTFVAFLEAYYEWLEQQGQTINVTKNIGGYFDIDTATKASIGDLSLDIYIQELQKNYVRANSSVDVFVQELQKNYISNIPSTVLVDRALLLKHVKDFYRAKGTEKATNFLLRILFGGDAGNTSFYYPYNDVLKASDGKWFIEKSLKISDTYIDSNPVTDNEIIKTAFKNTLITGNTSGATAVVERVDVYYDGATLVKEIKISKQTKDFVSGEQIFTLYNDKNNVTHTLLANTFSGIVNRVSLLNPGTGYISGTNIPVESNTGNGAIIQIGSVTPGNIKSVYVVYGGAGFRQSDPVIFSGGGGTGANANVSVVLSNNYYHPNSYNIAYSTISLEANTPINNTVYSNLNSSNANTAIGNALSYFAYSNTGPAVLINMISGGNNYLTPPVSAISANARVRELGILGRMEIKSGGTNYQIGDKITFNNVFLGFGTGATANVTNVNANGTITEVHFQQVPGFPIGGLGYDAGYLPTASVASANGNGANIVVTSILAQGDILKTTSDKLGAIQSLIIVSGGAGYETPPTLNLTAYGDGTAQANATIVTGAYVYPGRYLDDTGKISTYSFLEDRDYYQKFAYVIKLNRSINEYRSYIKQLTHPAGMKLWGEDIFRDDYLATNTRFISINTSNTILVTGTYVATGNANGTTIKITTQRSTSGISNATVEYRDGPAVGNLSNGIFKVTPNSTNAFIFVQSQNTINGSGNVYTRIY